MVKIEGFQIPIWKNGVQSSINTDKRTQKPARQVVPYDRKEKNCNVLKEIQRNMDWICIPNEGKQSKTERAPKNKRVV